MLPSMKFSLFAILIVSSSAFLAPLKSKNAKKKGFSCYTGSGESPGESPTECTGEGEDTCIIRWKASGAGDISRYCTTAATCPQSGGFEEVVSGEKYIVRCCTGDGCNAGKPVSLPAGLYWIKGDGKYATMAVPSLKMEDFNPGAPETQRFQITPGDALKGDHTITVEGAPVSDTATKYIITSVGEGAYSVVYYPVPGAAALPFFDLKSGSFSLIKTIGGDWKVANFEKKCPSDSVKSVAASGPDACLTACLADPLCAVQQVFEWNGAECKLLVKPCGKTETGDDTLVTYSSK
jgi:hypothetical protein